MQYILHILEQRESDPEIHHSFDQSSSAPPGQVARQLAAMAALEGHWGWLNSYQCELIGAERMTFFIRGPSSPDFPDGRRLAIQVAGAINGYPIFLFHGSPGSRIGPAPDKYDLMRMGTRLISYDRPGYGYSDPNPGRRPWDTVADMEAIVADLRDRGTLGAEQTFSIVGRSGGGPHALACAAGLEGVDRVVTLASPAPPYLLGNKQLEGMGGANAPLFKAVSDGKRDEAIADLRDLIARTRKNPRKLLRHLSEQGLTPKDAGIIAVLKSDLLASYRRGLESGQDGWIDDFLGVTADWGFKLSDIKKPEVFIGYGGKDPFSPKQNGDYFVENIRRVPVTQFYAPESSHFDTGLSEYTLGKVFRWCRTGQYNVINKAEPAKWKVPNEPEPVKWEPWAIFDRAKANGTIKKGRHGIDYELEIRPGGKKIVPAKEQAEMVAGMLREDYHHDHKDIRVAGTRILVTNPHSDLDKILRTAMKQHAPAKGRT